MTWSGSGTFSRIVTTVSPSTGGTTIDSADMNTYTTDTASGINACLAKNGENAATGDLDIGSNKITALADGTASTDAATVGQVQDGGMLYASTVGGTADAITLAFTPTVTALTEGQAFRFKAGSNNTGATTVDVDTIGAVDLQSSELSALEANDIVANGIYTIVYDGTQFQIQKQRQLTAMITSDVTWAQDTTLKTTGLTFTNLEVGYYAYEGYLYFFGGSGIADDGLKGIMTGTNMTHHNGMMSFGFTTTKTVYAAHPVRSLTEWTFTAANLLDDNDTGCRITGVVEVTSATNTVDLQLAQQSAIGANTLNLDAYSWVKLTKIG